MKVWRQDKNIKLTLARQPIVKSMANYELDPNSISNPKEVEKVLKFMAMIMDI